MMDPRPTKHEPVMVEEVLHVLPLRPGALVVDGTIGLGGHSLRFLPLIAPGGALVGFDWDAQMLAIAEARIGTPEDARVELVNQNFRSIPEVLGERRPDAILLDLGLNSAQVDDASRGMSFIHGGPLDMRMDRSVGEPASALLNRMGPGEIEQMLWDLGDERWARAIARKIVEHRKMAPLRTTIDLVECVLAAIPAGARDKRIHPATRTFQAVRIYVNRELDDLGPALEEIAGCLAPGGVLAVLSYHSGEDRIVKTAFRALDGVEYEDVYRKPLTPTDGEIGTNPRSRSAKLRALRRNEIKEESEQS